MANSKKVAGNKSFHVRLPEELVERIEAERLKDTRPSASNMVEVLIREALDARDEK